MNDLHSASSHSSFLHTIMEEETSDKRRKLSEMLRILACKVRI